eukprot:jgi/Orpsp1_1/1179724/evm.model.c7180000070534.1
MVCFNLWIFLLNPGSPSLWTSLPIFLVQIVILASMLLWTVFLKWDISFLLIK